VARAFYTALAEALLVKQKLPNLSPAQVKVYLHKQWFLCLSLSCNVA
jgi:hypothetical protein